MHRFTRAAIAIAVGAVALGLLVALLPAHDGVVPVTTDALLRTGVQALGYKQWYALGEYPALVVIYLLPAILIAAVSYTLAARHAQATELDDGPRCRRCGYILRGLPEPRCPECGERI